MDSLESKVAAVETKINEHSFAYDLLCEFKALNKRLFIIIMVILFLWFATIGGFVWYLNQYEFTSYEYDLSIDGGGNANYIGNDGDIYNGESSSQNSNPDKEKQ